MPIDLESFLRSEYIDLELHEALKQPPDVLLGVSERAAEALKRIGVNTVFDLGTSWMFANARAAANAAQTGTLSARHGIAPTDLLDDTVVVTELDDIGELDLSALRAMNQGNANVLKAALDLTTIRDFAYWPPQMIARQLVGEVMGATVDPEDLQSEELRPRLGEFPTERTYYNTLVMLQMGDQQDDLTPLEGPLALNSALKNRLGFGKIAVGAQLTFSQSWFAVRLTLGQLLHSLALAPGEATRIALIDWSRRTRATASEAISESEQLDNVATHSRAISEVQNAVANEFQAGGSTSSSSSSSTSASAAMSASTGFLTSLWASGSASGTVQTATTQTSASSSSWSLGNRSVFAEMNQNVNDRTEQHSTSVRNRRATAVREVSQSESEQISTRIVANYNHMHALTVQYFEVVQIYRVVAKLNKAERCLFIPMQMLNFTVEGAFDLVDQFRGALLAAALNRRVASLLIDDTTTVAVMPTTAEVRVATFRPDLLSAATMETRFSRGGVLRETPAIAAALSSEAEVAGSAEVRAVRPAAGVQYTKLGVWNEDAIARISNLLDRTIVRPDSDALHFPDDAEIIGLSFEGLNIKSVRLDRVDVGVEDSTFTVPTNSQRLDVPLGVRLLDLDSIHLEKADQQARSGKLYLHLSYRGRRFNSPAVPVELAAGMNMQRVVEFENDRADRRQELLAHMQANRVHYSNAIFRSLDSATIVSLLAPFSFDGRPLIDQVEPKPLAVAGNFLVLRAPVDDEDSSGVREGDGTLTWGDLLKHRQVYGEPDTRLIPIPTAGVFAEAVLGRSNSAEKLDITRFWNWQDSPIPLSPPEIAPVSAGSRAQEENLTPGQLSQPVLNILNPTNLPDPAGLGVALNALATSNLFRDMSGLAGTQSLAQAGLEGTLSAATDAGKLASENMKTEAQKAVAMAQVLGDIVKAYLGVPSSGKDNKGISGEGAKINQGKDMDKRGVGKPEAGGQSDGAGGNGASGSNVPQGGGSANNAPSGGGSGNVRGANEQVAFDQSVGNPANIVDRVAEGANSNASSSAAAGAALGEGGQVWRPPAGISTLKVWLKAFIPENVPGKTITISGGPHDGKTALEGPFLGVSDCFLTDQRDFSNNISASARMHSEIELRLDRETPSFSQVHRCGETIEVDCEDGDEECRQTPSTARMSFHNLRVLSPTVVSVQLRAAANNPCFTGSPDIDYEGTLIVDLTAMTVTFDGKIDEFPAYEAYVTRDGSAPATIFQEPPPPGNDPSDLFGSANRPVGRSVPIPPAP